MLHCQKDYKSGERENELNNVLLIFLFVFGLPLAYSMIWS